MPPILEKQAESLQEVIVIPESIQGQRLLIVDGSETNRFVLREFMQSWGYRVAEAENGTEALDMMHTAVNEQDAFHMALIDMRMPERDGRKPNRVDSP